MQEAAEPVSSEHADGRPGTAGCRLRAGIGAASGEFTLQVQAKTPQADDVVAVTLIDPQGGGGYRIGPRDRTTSTLLGLEAATNSSRPSCRPNTLPRQRIKLRER